MKQNFIVIILAVALAYANETTDELKIEILKKGTNCREKSESKDVVFIEYTGKLENGFEFDKHTTYSKSALAFTLGSGLIEGWEQGLLGMCIGEIRKLTIPHHLAFGAVGYYDKVPANTTVIYEMKLTKLKKHHTAIEHNEL